MGLLEVLVAREKEGRPIRVAVVGAGQMGSGLVRQMAGLPGWRLAGVCDLIPARAAAAAAQAGVDAGEANGPEEVRRLVREGRSAITTRAEWLAGVPEVDAVLDATGDPETGARLGLAAVSAGKPFITMNVEADVTVGPILAWMARRAGVVYTVAAGDEPSVLCDMVDFARTIGLEVVCAGKGKNNRLDHAATARSVEAEAASRGMSARMLAAFVDGTKTMVEMAALANATGLRPDCPGMHGPQANLNDLLHTFVPASHGGILRHRGAVDYAIGDVAPGVFLVGTTSSEPVRRDLAYLKMGDGPYYLLHRPYHLASLEAPLSVARAVLRGEVTMAAAGAPVAECLAVAKRDLRPGDILDGIGGETVYGFIETAERAVDLRAVPLGLAHGARVCRDVARGSVLVAGDLVLDESQTIVHLRRLQERLVEQRMLGAPPSPQPSPPGRERGFRP